MKSIFVVAVLFITITACAQGPAVDIAHLMQPADLAQIIQSKSPKPLILNIGPRMLYAQAHITGAELIGPAADPRAIEALKARMKSVAKNQAIVLYCGCCPWSHCPNVEPAYKLLRDMGYTNVKVLFIANNIGADWVYKGYPTVKGQ